eukprot:4195878-Pyramimonas_sp.AAC.1
MATYGLVNLHERLGSTQASDIRKELMGQLNSQVRRWLNKVLTVNSTVYAPSWRGGFERHPTWTPSTR